MNQALLLIDIQNDYFTNGAMALVGMEAAADKAALLLQAFRTTGRPVYHIRHLSLREGSTFFLPGTPGADLHQAVQPLAEEVVIEKHFPNSFRGTGLLEQCRRDAIDQLVICGAMSHMCIDATTRAAFDLEFSCQVIADACATRNLVFAGREVQAADVHASFMAALHAVYAQVMTSADFQQQE